MNNPGGPVAPPNQAANAGMNNNNNLPPTAPIEEYINGLPNTMVQRRNRARSVKHKFILTATEEEANTYSALLNDVLNLANVFMVLILAYITPDALDILRNYFEDKDESAARGSGLRCGGSVVPVPERALGAGQGGSGEVEGLELQEAGGDIRVQFQRGVSGSRSGHCWFC